MSTFRFVQIYPDAPLPVRGDRGLSGTVLLRAFQFCEPFCAANELGWLAFPPIDFALKWDGTNVSWYVADSDDWSPLRSAVLPGFADSWARTDHCDGKPEPPTFLSALPEPGLVQIWPGLVARSPEGWALLVRPPANNPRSLGFEVLEGVIETDWWFGPLITTIRLCQTNEPILFSRQRAIIAMHPVPKVALGTNFYESVRIERGAEAFSETDWQEFKYALSVHGQGGRPGGYKAAARTRRRRVK
jgi:hypothetical protein